MSTPEPAERGGPPVTVAAAAGKLFRVPRAKTAVRPLDLDMLDRKLTTEWYRRKAEVLMLAIPTDYRGATFPQDEAGRLALRWVLGYHGGYRGGLYIHGPVGTGKTWLAAAIARELLTVRSASDGFGAPVLVRFTSTTAMLQSLRPGDHQEELESYTGPPVLVLDDLGTERYTEWEAEQLFNLAHARRAERRPTIVTSNLEPAQVSARYERRTVERLFQDAWLVPMTGASRRTLPPGF